MCIRVTQLSKVVIYIRLEGQQEVGELVRMNSYLGHSATKLIYVRQHNGSYQPSNFYLGTPSFCWYKLSNHTVGFKHQLCMILEVLKHLKLSFWSLCWQINISLPSHPRIGVRCYKVEGKSNEIPYTSHTSNKCVWPCTRACSMLNPSSRKVAC